MTAYERMAVALDATGLYHLEKAPRMSAEMQAYGAVLDQIYEDLRECLYGAFLDEIDNPYSGYHERLFGFSRTANALEPLDVELRKQKIEAMKKRLSITNEDFNPSGLQKALESYGMTVSFTEHPAEKTVDVAVTADLNLLATEEEKETVIKELLPCHVTPVVTFAAE